MIEMASFNDRVRLYELLHKKMSGELLLPERIELAELLQKNDNEQAANFFEEIFSLERTFNQSDFGGSGKRVKEKLFREIQSIEPVTDTITVGHRVFYLKYISIAALFILIAGASIFYLKNTEKASSPGESKTISASTNKGSKSSIVLPDGSRVWINADTKLTCEEDFGKKDRVVNLVGEAYFDVVKEASRPFFVRTTHLTVKVLGTAFNVKAYPGSSRTETTLINGRVEVSLTNDSLKKIVLKPREKLSVVNETAVPNNSDGSIHKKISQNISITDITEPVNDSIAFEVQWIKNRLVFNNTRLDEIAGELSRWYNIEVHIAENNLKAIQYNGVFEDESLSQVLEALKLTGGFHYKIDKNIVTIYP